MTAPQPVYRPEPCPLHNHQPPSWHVTFINRDGASRYATTTDPDRMRTPAGWTFLGWGWL